MSIDALHATLVELVERLDGRGIRLILGGGYGLYLKQEYLTLRDERTLIPVELLAPSRSTEDLDLFLRTEILADTARMTALKATLHEMGFQPRHPYWCFEVTTAEGATVRIDLLTGPFDDGTRTKLHVKQYRVRPRGVTKIHATRTDEAIGLEEHLVELPLRTAEREQTVFLPHPFTYLVMKLHAFGDRQEDERKDFARHHAMDIYRIVAMLTEDEYEVAKEQADRFMESLPMQTARTIVTDRFTGRDSLGVIRLRESNVGLGDLLDQVDSGFSAGGDALDEFLGVLRDIFRT